MIPTVATDLLIRPATAADAGAVSRFNWRMAREWGRTIDHGSLVRGVSAVLGDPALGRYFLAAAGSEPVGQLQVTAVWDDWRDGFVWWADALYVTRPWRGRGVDDALAGHVLALADADPRVVAVRLEVATDARRGAGLRRRYLRLRFSGVGEVMEWPCRGGGGPRVHPQPGGPVGGR